MTGYEKHTTTASIKELILIALGWMACGVIIFAFLAAFVLWVIAA